MKKISNSVLCECPVIKGFWDKDNNTVDVANITKGSKKIIAWKCPECGNQFRLSVTNFINRKHKCLCCYKQSSLIVNNPEVYRIWDKHKNIKDPFKTTIHCKEIAYWKCPNCKHEWQSKIYNIRKGECPCCTNRKVIISGKNDLLTIVPDLSLDFSESLNPNINLTKLRVSSHDDIVWKCHICSFEWKTKLYSRIINNKGNYTLSHCPNCCMKKGIKPKKATPNYNFAILYPDLLKEWDPENKISPYNLLPSSNKIVKWICSENQQHKWNDTVKNRTSRGFRCKICHPYKQLFCKEFPKLVTRYSSKNKFSFYKATKYSNKVTTWNCENGHEIKRTFSTITSNNGKLYCQFCSNSRPLEGYNTIIDLYPSLSNEWDKNSNDLIGLYINKTLPSSRVYAWWLCRHCGKSYPMRIDQKVKMSLRNKITCKYCNKEYQNVVHFL